MAARSIRHVVMIVLFAGMSFGMAQELRPIQLPPPQMDLGKPLMQALKLRQSSRSFDRKPLSMQEISNLLWAADGINRPESGKRTAPSARNWQEVDIYVTLPEGVYLYDAKAHALTPVVAGDLREATGAQEFVKDAPLNLVYVADYTRMSNVSDDDRRLFSGADVGFIAQNVYLYCASEGLAVVVRAGVNRAAFSEALKLRAEQKIILGQTIGYPK